MAKRKLTPKLKEYLYVNRNKVKLSDYAGDALAYLKRLRAASKAAKTRKQKVAQVGDTTIPQDSELYYIIESSAKAKKQSVATFIKKNKEAINELIKDGNIVLQRETSYAIKDIEKLPKRSKVYINGEVVSKGDAIYALQSITSSAMQHTTVVVMNYEMTYDLKGNLHLTLPTEQEIENAEELSESNPNDTTYDELINSANGFIAIQSGKKK
jgi:hypothetical protein